jgi:hypothetical protein
VAASHAVSRAYWSEKDHQRGFQVPAQARAVTSRDGGAAVRGGQRDTGITEHGRPYGRVLCEGPPGVPGKTVKPGGDTQPSGSSPTSLSTTLAQAVTPEDVAARIRDLGTADSKSGLDAEAGRRCRRLAAAAAAEEAKAARTEAAALRAEVRTAVQPELVAAAKLNRDVSWTSLLHVRSPHYTNVY